MREKKSTIIDRVQFTAYRDGHEAGVAAERARCAEIAQEEANLSLRGVSPPAAGLAAHNILARIESPDTGDETDG